MAENGEPNTTEIKDTMPRVGGGGNGRQAASSGLPKGIYPQNLETLSYGSLAVTEAAKDKMCRNLYIYGYCKFEGKGCAFRHDRV
jgi:hypothetical protein